MEGQRRMKVAERAQLIRSRQRSSISASLSRLPLCHPTYSGPTTIAMSVILHLTNFWAAFSALALRLLAIVLSSLIAHGGRLWAVLLGHPTYLTAEGEHVIRNRKPGRIYITRVSPFHPLARSNPPPQPNRYWLEDGAFGRYLQMGYIFCPEDRRDLEVVGGKATQGCYIQGGFYDHYVIQELGAYVDDRASIRSGDDSKQSILFKTRTLELTRNKRTIVGSSTGA